MSNNDAHQALPLQSQDTEIGGPPLVSATSHQNPIDELNLVQNPSVDQVQPPQLTSSSHERNQTEIEQLQSLPLVSSNHRRLFNQRGSDDLLDQGEESPVVGASDQQNQISGLEIQTEQPRFNRLNTLTSNNSIQNRDSTLSFTASRLEASPSQPPNNQAQLHPVESVANPFAAASTLRLNSGSSASFLSSSVAGQQQQQRARPGGPLTNLQSLDSGTLNPFGMGSLAVQAPSTLSGAQADHLLDRGDESITGANPSLQFVVRNTANAAEEQKGGEQEDFARMLADNSNTNVASPDTNQNRRPPPFGLNAPTLAETAFQSGNSQPYQPQAVAPVQQQSSQMDQGRLARSRSMYDTFAGARPFGLLSGMTNQRLPDQPVMRRQSSHRSFQQPQAEADNQDAQSHHSSLRLSRQGNEEHSMSPSPSARLRYMNVPGLPRANSRISNSDRQSQASGTPRGSQRRLLQSTARVTRLAPVSPLPGFSPSLLAQDMPNLHNRLRRQPATPNPSGARPYMRLNTIQPEDQQAAGEDMFERPTSDAGRSQRSQRSISNRGGAAEPNSSGINAMTMAIPRSASRRSLLEPLRPGEEIFSPGASPSPPSVPRLGNQQRPRVPPVPLEPLQPVPEEPPTVGMQQSLINPVPHVELQQTARFAARGANPDRLGSSSSQAPLRSLTHSNFNIRLLPAQDPGSGSRQSRARQRGDLNVTNWLTQADNRRRRHGISIGQIARGNSGEPDSFLSNAGASRTNNEGQGEDVTESAAMRAAHERILRSLTGAQINLSGGSLDRNNQNFEMSDSNSNKSEDEDDDSSLANYIEQDEILDSVSEEDSEEKDTFDVESDWSECDQIFGADLDDLHDLLTAQNEQNAPERRVNIENEIGKVRKEQELAKDVVKSFGTLAVVMLYRSNRHGTLFDHDLFQKLCVLLPASRDVFSLARPKIQQFMSKVLKLIHRCFQTLQSTTYEIPPSTITNRQAYQFLDMVYKVLPSDQAKLRRVTMEKTIPNLIKLTQELEDLNLTQSSPADSAAHNKKVKAIERKAQLYMKELLLAKVITDFKIQFEVVTGLTSSSRARQLTHSLLPFAMELQISLPQRLNSALYHLILRHVPSSCSKYHDLQNAEQQSVNLHGSFIVHEIRLNGNKSQNSAVISYYKDIFLKLLELHKPLLNDDSPTKSQNGRSVKSKLKLRREDKKLRKQRQLFTML